MRKLKTYLKILNLFLWHLLKQTEAEAIFGEKVIHSSHLAVKSGHGLTGSYDTHYVSGDPRDRLFVTAQIVENATGMPMNKLDYPGVNGLTVGEKVDGLVDQYVATVAVAMISEELCKGCTCNVNENPKGMNGWKCDAIDDDTQWTPLDYGYAGIQFSIPLSVSQPLPKGLSTYSQVVAQFPCAQAKLNFGKFMPTELSLSDGTV